MEMDKNIESQSELLHRIQRKLGEKGDAPISKVISNIGMIYKEGIDHQLHRTLNMWNTWIEKNGEERNLEEINDNEQLDWEGMKKVLEGGKAEEMEMMEMEVDDCVEGRVKGDGKENLAKSSEEKEEAKEDGEKMVSETVDKAKDDMDCEMEVATAEIEKQKEPIDKLPKRSSSRARKAAANQYSAMSKIFHVGKSFLAPQAKAAQDALPPQAPKRRGRPPKAKNIKKAEKRI